MTVKPLLLLDVDGVLNPYAWLTKRGFAEPKKLKKTYAWEVVWVHPEGFDKGLRLVLTKDHAKELRKLATVFNIVWATTWNEEANVWLNPYYDLPKFPVLEFPSDDDRYVWTRAEAHKGHWKTKFVARWLDNYGWYKNAQGELTRLPWAFADDNVNRYDRSWLQGWWSEKDSPAEYLVHRVEPSRGLTSDDFKALYKFGLKNQCE